MTPRPNRARPHPRNKPTDQRRPAPVASTVTEGALIATLADFDENGALTRDFLLRRGRCCQEGCRNCPYGFVAPAESSGRLSDN
ncbi:MAG: DUF5522 domain-containing protein [Spartobacteria bacterium]